MKTKIIIIIIAILVIGVTGYKVIERLTRQPAIQQEVSIPVQTVIIKPEQTDNYLAYEGRVSASKIEKISFKSTARLEQINGIEGEIIKPDQVFIQLDTSDLQLSLEAAEEKLKGAKANYDLASKGTRPEDKRLAQINVDKAKRAVDFYSQKLQELENLYQEGVVSRSEVDNIKLQLDLAVQDQELAATNYQKAINGAEQEVVQAAKSQYELAKTNRQASQDLLQDASYKVPSDRILIKKMYQVGELVPAGYPVAIVRSLEQQVVVGVSSKDLDQIHLGQRAVISHHDKQVAGKVTKVSEVPDEKHYLYQVEVTLDQSIYKIGEIAKVEISVGKSDEIWIPIAAVKNDGIDYVYLVKEGRAVIKKVKVIESKQDQLAVEGLVPGDQVITGNINKIQEQSLVTSTTE